MGHLWTPVCIPGGHFTFVSIKIADTIDTCWRDRHVVFSGGFHSKIIGELCSSNVGEANFNVNFAFLRLGAHHHRRGVPTRGVPCREWLMEQSGWWGGPCNCPVLWGGVSELIKIALDSPLDGQSRHRATRATIASVVVCPHSDVWPNLSPLQAKFQVEILNSFTN